MRQSRKRPRQRSVAEINRERDAMHRETLARHAELIAALQHIIAAQNLIIWIRQSDGTDALVNAVDVYVNGKCVQIEADPTFTLEYAASIKGQGQ